MIDIQTAKKLGAIDYIPKPVDQDEMIKVALTVHERWLSGASPGETDSTADFFPPRKQNLP